MTREAVGPIYIGMPQFFGGTALDSPGVRVLPHEELRDVVALVGNVLDSPRGRTYLETENRDIAQAMRSVGGFAGAFGIGFPYYAPEGKVTEITTFLGRTDSLIRQDQRRNPHGWGCPDCQVVNKLPDLKTLCKPCDKTDLKPRDVFKALPDLDIFVATDTVSPQTEKEVRSVVNGLGYSQSDTDIKSSIRATRNVLTALERDAPSAAKLPIDIHLVSTDSLTSSMRRMVQGDLDTPLSMRSLHTIWEDDRIPFAFDFLFSFTVLESQQELGELIQQTRRDLMRNYGKQTLVNFVKNSSPRAEGLVEDTGIRTRLEQRFTTWAET